MKYDQIPIPPVPVPTHRTLIVNVGDIGPLWVHTPVSEQSVCALWIHPLPPTSQRHLVGIMIRVRESDEGGARSKYVCVGRREYQDSV